MAKLNGWSLGKVTKFMGMEGEGWQAMVSKDGKQLGMYTEDASGGGGRWDGNWSDVKDLEAYGYGMDNFFDDLLLLVENEKSFKKAIKKGYGAFAISLSEHGSGYASMLPKGFDEDAFRQQMIKEFGGQEHEVTIFRTLEDFNVTKTKGRPSWYKTV